MRNGVTAVGLPSGSESLSPEHAGAPIDVGYSPAGIPSATDMETCVAHEGPVHTKARGAYPGASVSRFPVKDCDVPWIQPLDNYQPVEYTASAVLSKPIWADPPAHSKEFRSICFNTVDADGSSRQSYEGAYKIVAGLPQNPRGRTGMVGRGLLGKWGPNHAADPIVTRWADEGKTKLEFVSILRRDGGGWALPGGMVDANEDLSEAAKREFSEEALDTLSMSETERTETLNRVQEVFASGVEIYSGYVDDPRNTDNAWMETKAYNFHDNEGSAFSAFDLKAGDDAAKVQWMLIDKAIDDELYASHAALVRAAAQRLGVTV